jgi:predicted MPP superfamily phosphohydrolase
MRPLRVLQVSDIHMVSGQRKKQRWLRSLAGLRPDFVINTGDNLSDPEGIPEVLDSLGPLMEFPGAYVFGSNDYYGPRLRNPARYLREKAQGRHGLNGNPPAVSVVHIPWEDMRDAFDAAGWLNLTNTRGTLKIEGVSLELTGLDDPHIKRDRYAQVARRIPPTSPWVWSTLRTCARWTPSRPTATPWSWPATPTAASCASPSTGPWSPTATWTRTA